MGQRRHLRARGLAGVVALVGIVLGSLAPARASATPTDEAVVTAVGLDHSSRGAVRNLYNNVLKPALQVPIGWTGSVDGCNAGAPSAAAQTATLTAVNYFRTMAGLPDVTFDPALSAKAQAAALMFHANNKLDHDPPASWACYTAAGYDGASHSNIGYDSSGSGARIITNYMRDSEANNTAAGHRRWILYPPETTMGSGSTSTRNALYVLGPFGARPAGAPTWSAWPAAGYFPAQIEPAGRWSLTNANAYFENATVTVHRGATPIAVTKQPVSSDSYGDNTLVWDLAPGFTLGGADQVYTVNVSGIEVLGNPNPVSYSYTVRLFDANLDTPSAPTNVVARSGLDTVRVTWNAPASNGGSAITKYTATASPSGKSCVWTSGPLTCTVTGLSSGPAQTFKVTATTGVGAGAASAASNQITPGQSCGTYGLGPFTDVPGGHLFCGDIQWLVRGDIAGGYPDGSFLPAAAVTRQSMAAFLYRLAGSPAFTPPVTPTFADVPKTHPFYKEIQWLAAKDIANGYPDGTFGANLEVTRQSTAAFLYRFAGTPAFTPPATPSFTDVPKTRAFFKEIEWLAAHNIAGGFEDGTFRPTTAVSRQAMAAFLHRLPA